MLNEAGDANVIIYDGLTSQMAALMMMVADNRPLWERLHTMVNDYVSNRKSSKGLIGYRAKITNTREINNTWIDDDCEINGASCISETTLKGMTEASVFIGHDVICKNSVVMAGASVLDGAKIDNCFVGEACHVGRGFSAESSIFFANSYMDNGEACAAFCGPFSVSHHKASLLIGVETSFYNAGSATNFSNHAYKMGPIHYGSLQRGSKTASGAHILMPAQIGAFSMCMGKIQSHPHSTDFPFSYVIADGATTWLVPGCNLATVGTYRDTAKWPRRDMRPQGSRRSMVDTEWLNPSTMTKVVEAKVTLEALRDQKGAREVYQTADGSLIKRSALEKGISLYTLAIKLYLDRHLKSADEEADYNTSFDDTTASQTFGRPLSRGASLFADLGGMQISNASVMRIVDAITSGNIDTTEDLMAEICRYYDGGSLDTDIDRKLALRIADAIYGWNSMDADDRRRLIDSCHEARREWYDMVRRDAEREYELGDVDDATLNGFLAKLEEEEPAS